MLEKISPKDPIVICDIGASECEPIPSIQDLMNNSKSILYGFEPNEDEFKNSYNQILKNILIME